MRLAEHLAVPDVRRPALRPRRHVVRVHFGELVDARTVRRVTDCAQGTVRHALLLRRGGLLRIDRFRLLRVENPDIEKLRVLLTPEDVLEDAAAVFHEVVRVERPDALPHLLRIVGALVIGLVEPSPVKSAHLVLRPLEDAVNPVDDRLEVGLELSDVRVATVLAHIAVDVAP